MIKFLGLCCGSNQFGWGRGQGWDRCLRKKITQDGITTKLV